MTAADPPLLALEHRYRPEIDGLRAVAVILVVLYHAKLGMPGGYIGVDVFFVISGYLIGSLIAKDLVAGRFSLLAFWERRVRRIMPALLVICAATLAAGWFLLLPDDLMRLGRSAVAQSLFFANYHFSRRHGYFADTDDDPPLLHTWSLAVEEQYYFVVPLVLLAAWRVARLRNRGAIAALCVVFIGVSLALSIYGVKRGKPWAFYGLESRLWELLIGGTLTLLPTALMARRRWAREVMSLLGLGLILWAALTYRASTPFPARAAIPPCAGAALIIAANSASPTLTGRLLALRPAVFVGLISYSLYLWHWPLLVLVDYRLGPSGPLLRWCLLGIALALAAASWRWVETPFRRRTLCASRRSIFTLAFIGLASVLTAGLVIGANGFDDRFPPFVAACARARSDFAFHRQAEPAEVIAGNTEKLGTTAPQAPVELVVWGDSHAMAMAPAFDALCAERGIAGRLIARGGAPPVLGYTRPQPRINADQARAHNDAAIEYIERNNIRNVVLVAYWPSAGTRDDPADAAALRAGLLATVERLTKARRRTWIVLTVPLYSYNVPRTLARSVAFGETMPPPARPDGTNGIRGSDTALIHQLAEAGAVLIDPRPAFLDAAGEHYIVAADNVVYYKDSNHITTAGARHVLLPLLREKLTLGKNEE